MTEPIPIPLPVTIKPAEALAAIAQPSMAPNTTTEEDKHTASQRRVNMIWEHTQMAIALIVVVSTMVGGVYMTLRGLPESHMPTILSVAFGTVVGFYFGRTNHQYVGGVQLGR